MGYLLFLYGCSHCREIHKDDHIHVLNGLIVCGTCETPLKNSVIQIIKPDEL